MNKSATVPAEITGEIPLASFGEEFGGRNDFGLADWRNSGNMDAPLRIAAGSSSNFNWDGVPAASNFIRGR